MIEARQRLKCVIADLAATFISLLLFNICRYEWFIHNIKSWSLFDFLTSRIILIGWFTFPIMMLLIYYLSGAYYNVMKRSRLNELINTATSATIGSVIIYFTILIDDIVDDKATLYEMIGCLWLLFMIFVGSARMYMSTKLIRRVRNYRFGYNTLIVGINRASIDMVKRINRSPRSGYNIVGFINPTNNNTQTQSRIDLPIYPIDQIEYAINKHNAVNIIVMPMKEGLHATMRMINKLFPLGKSILISPMLMHVISGKSNFDNVSGEPLIDVSRPDISPSTASCKRAADIVVSAMALIFLLPVYIAIAVTIKIKSPNSKILYTQERIGYRKKRFKIIKFRTMHPDAEKNGPALSSSCDPRITSTGRFLRKYRLDELPQFWNVLKGDMSIVGPRPEREYYINRIIEQVPYYSLIHNVRPGITSWGMVKYGYATTVEQMVERLKYDLVYIENISFGVDMKIILYTIKTVITGRGI